MNSLLLWIGGLLVAVLGLLFAAPYAIDWNAYRGVLEEEASRILGRDVRVGGKVNLRLLPSPYVRFEKVRISDAGAALGEPFFRAEAFTLWLSPGPLLRGALEANELELDRPVLRLAVDAEGRGNWQALRITPGALPFVPSDVVLQQVRIKNGVVSLRTPGTPEPLTLSGIEGELAAASLDGPYRFRGMINWYGTGREIRIGTSQRETDGRLRYKATVRAPETGNVYSIDGALSELTAKARHNGILTARLPVAGLSDADAVGRARSGRGADVIDLKATIDGDIDGVKLTDLSFAFEQDGKPQLMNGESVSSWRNGLRIETRLASRWLDLDNIAGQEGGKAAPAEIVRRLLRQVSGLLPLEGNSLLTIDVEQVNLGGEALSGVRLALARAGGLTSIGELKATLPGNAKGELRGTLGAFVPTVGAVVGADGKLPLPPQNPSPPDSVGPANVFDGEFVLRGSSYRRFAAWAGSGALFQPAASEAATGEADAPFSIVSRLRLMPDALSLTNANIELGNREITAGVDWKWNRERQLEISLEGRAVDIGAFAPGTLDLAADTSQAAGDGSALHVTGSAVLQAIAARAAAIDRAVGGLRLKLRASELNDGTTTLGDVDADIALAGGKLAIASLKLGKAGAYRLDLQGELSSIAIKPTGALRGWLAADSREGLIEIARVLPSGARATVAHWLGQSRKADVGFSVTLGGQQTDRVVLTTDGFLDGAHVVLDLKLDGGMARWRDYPVDLAVSLEGAAAADIVRRMAGGRPSPAAARTSALETSVHVKAAGANAASLFTLATLKTTGGNGAERAGNARLSTLDFTGRSAVTANGGVELAGNLVVAIADASDLMLLLGASRRPLVVGIPVRGTIAIDRKAATTTLVSTTLDVGPSRVAGRLALTGSADRTRVDGEVTTTRVALTGLLGLVLDGDAAPVPMSDGGDAAGSPWTDAPFTLGMLDGIEGQFRISTDVAELTRGLELSGAEMSLGFVPGRLTISSLTGAALGGRFTARSTIEAIQAGANVSIEARLTGAKLDQLRAPPPSATQPGATQPGAKPGRLGEANVTLTLGGRGIGLRSAMSAMSGRGEAEIRNGRVVGLSPAMVEKAALAVIESNDELTRAALERIIATERGQGELALGDRKLPIEIVDGIVKFGVLEATTPEARVRNTTTVDLSTLKSDSEWQIMPRRALPGAAGGARREPLPPLTAVWSGPLAEIGRTSPRLSLDQLERDLSIRKMERDTERLEELRREDEGRAKTEAERLRRLDESARAPGTGLPPPAPVFQAPFPISPTPRPAPQLLPLPSPARRQSATDPPLPTVTPAARP